MKKFSPKIAVLVFLTGIASVAVASTIYNANTVSLSAAGLSCSSCAVIPEVAQASDKKSAECATAASCPYVMAQAKADGCCPTGAAVEVAKADCGDCCGTEAGVQMAAATCCSSCGDCCGDKEKIQMAQAADKECHITLIVQAIDRALYKIASAAPVSCDDCCGDKGVQMAEDVAAPACGDCCGDDKKENAAIEVAVLPCCDVNAKSLLARGTE